MLRNFVSNVINTSNCMGLQKATNNCNNNPTGILRRVDSSSSIYFYAVGDKSREINRKIARPNLAPVIPLTLPSVNSPFLFFNQLGTDQISIKAQLFPMQRFDSICN